MTAWVAWRLVKFLAVVALGGGVAAVMGRPARQDRLQLAVGVVVPAFLAVWLSGYALLHETHRALEPWALAAAATSAAAMYGVLRLAFRPEPEPKTAAFVVGALAATVAEMVLRPGADGLGHLISGLVGVAASLGVAGTLRPAASPGDPSGEALARAILTWGSRLEGASLVGLIALSVVRRAAHLDLGAVPALLGWTHGAMFVVWLCTLAAGGRALGWGPVPLAVGAVTAVIPGGWLLFERVAPRS